MSSKEPTADPAEHNAFFPSPYSLGQYVPPRTDFDGANHERTRSTRRKVLLIGADERYLRVQGDRYFSTGNHPVETLLPALHLEAAGYDVEVATASGNLMKYELWAFPAQDDAVKDIHRRLLPKTENPKKLSDVIAEELGPDSDYAAVFVPGGHGAMINMADDPDIGTVLAWALENNRVVITLCHGPAALLAARNTDGNSLFAGYEVCAFPDTLDQGANVEIGYLPGQLTWLLAERLREQGVHVVNDDMSGAVHRDRLVLTGDSPLAANALGNLAVSVLAETETTGNGS
ncbi:glyoxalase III HchA [Flexivirga oryzae]|uniref:Molecular chaperone Hsp31 and glyoxalase 3 n=1 Tax=Flexivirga oryzae TaxID=1794944 RepID=A0A839N2N5_9MICO|nr:glyoxalase III HchA [Flexivirga oryzae]MBB2892000.1 molecular chaperone Hsp31 and glyoxalase 3 [Flexivirga oryzae]